LSDSNGHEAPIPTVGRNGGVNLQAYQLDVRVREIAEATIKKPLPTAPVVREELVINHKGDVSQVNVDFVREHVDAKRWQIVAKLGILGIDPSIGEWSLVDIGYGEDKEGRLVSHHALVWSVPSVVKDESTPLAIVK
jgi:hypothetical protein